MFRNASRVALFGMAAAFVLFVAGCDNKLSDPKSAAKTFMNALLNNDPATAKKAANITSEDQGKAIETMCSMMAAVQDFQSALQSKFGDAGKKALGPMGAGREEFEKKVKELDNADVKIEGDNATVTIKSEAKPLKLKKVGSDWKMDITSEFAPSKKDVEQIQKMIAGMQKVTADIKAGKYTKAEEVQPALMKAMMGS